MKDKGIEGPCGTDSLPGEPGQKEQRGSVSTDRAHGAGIARQQMEQMKFHWNIRRSGHMLNLEPVYTCEGTNEVHSLLVGRGMRGFDAF